MKRAITLCAVVFSIMLLVLTGCGGGKSTKTAGKGGAGAKEGPAQPVESAKAGGGEGYFQGKTMDFIVPFASGGGYDTYARMIAPYLKKYLEVTTVVKNLPGAGGIIGTNQLYSSKPDGLTIGILSAVGLISSQIAGAEGVKFDLRQMTWLARITSEPFVIVGRKDLAQADVIAKGKVLNYDSAGVGTTDFIVGNATKLALGTDWKIVTGFEGTSQIFLALTRKDIDLAAAYASSVLPGIKNGDMKPLLVIGSKAWKDYPNTPLASKQNVTPEGRTILETLNSFVDITRLIAAPPGVPENIAKTLADGIDKILKDPDFLKQAASLNSPIENLNPTELTKMVRQSIDAPETFKKLIRDSYKS